MDNLIKINKFEYISGVFFSLIFFILFFYFILYGYFISSLFCFIMFMFNFLLIISDGFIFKEGDFGKGKTRKGNKKGL